MKATIKFCGSEMTGTLIEKTEATVTIEVTHKNHGRSWKTKPFIKRQYCTDIKNLVSTETESIKETANSLNKIFGF